MSQVYEFIKDCGVFFVLTVNGESPAGRPFGAIMEYGSNLYIATGDGKSVYNQLKEHGQIQLLALKVGTRSWARVSGMAAECEVAEMKQRMMKECPNLKKHYDSPSDPHFCLFQICVTDAELYV